MFTGSLSKLTELGNNRTNEGMAKAFMVLAGSNAGSGELNRGKYFIRTA